jgi:adenylate cyclase
VAQEYGKAVAFYRRALLERPHASWIYRNLASALVGAGQVEEARQAFAEMMRHYPDLTVAKFKQAMVFSQITVGRMAQHLQSLGLSE